MGEPTLFPMRICSADCGAEPGKAPTEAVSTADANARMTAGRTMVDRCQEPNRRAKFQSGRRSIQRARPVGRAAPRAACGSSHRPVYCQGESGGALRHQYAKIHAGPHTKLQPGIGGYAPFDATWRTQEEAACLQTLNAWSGWEGPR